MELIWKTVLACMSFNSVFGSRGHVSNLIHGLVPLLQSASQDIVHLNCFLIVTDGSSFHDYVVQEITPHFDTPILLETRQHLHETHTATSAGDSNTSAPKITCKFKIFLIADANEVLGVVRDILRDKNLQKPVRLAFVSFEPNRKFSRIILESEPLQRFGHAICIRPFRKGGRIRWEIRTHSPLQKQPRIRTLGVWNSTALINTSKTYFFPPKFLNFYGSELKVCSFLYEPYITQFNETQRIFSGAEISFIQLMGQIMNFTPVFYSPPDGFRWGVPVNNDSWRGLYGELQKGNTDLAVASLYYARGYLPFLDMAYPHYSDCLTILTVKPGQKPRYNAIGQPFGIDLWAVTFVFFILSGLLPTVLAEIYYRLIPTNNPGMFFRKPDFAVFYNVQAITGTMSTDDRSPWPIRISVSFTWAIFFILICGYRAYLTSSFSLPGYFPSVDTVNQFLASRMEWSAYAETKRFLTQSEDSTNRKIGDGIQLLDRTVTTRPTVTSRMAYIDSRNYLEYVALTTNLDRHGSPTLQPIKECLVSYNVAVGMVKHSPLKETLSRITLRVLQSGLIQESFKDISNERRVFAQRNISAVVNERSSLVLSLEDLQGAFYVYLVCLTPSFIAFIFECCLCRPKKKVLNTYIQRYQ